MNLQKRFIKMITLPGIIVASCSSPESYNIKPNIILILTDDLGYGELGCYGQNLIETPNIDKLAENGIRFTQHYAGSPVCAPSRCVLLTGKHTGNSDIRGNGQWASRDDVGNNRYLAAVADSTLEGQFPLLEDTRTIGTFLQQEGYTTGIVGKWGLGAPPTRSTPLQKGFDFFYGYNCRSQAHTFFPLHLYKNDKRVYLDNDNVPPGTKLDEGADPYDINSYNKYTLKEYSPDLMFREITNFVEANRDNPFFMYWATPIPHVPIQAPKEWVDYYVNKFGDEEPYLGDKGYFPHRYPRAGYAAMITYLDDQVGQLVQQLKTLGIYENTLIIFTSDNGPTFNGGSDSPWFDSAKPFKSEHGWGKNFLHEGGIRVPFIAHWPGKIKPGTQSDHISAFWDILPTLCEVAGTDSPDDTDGISFLPALKGDSQKEHEFLYWEYSGAGGQQAVRIKDWKGIRKNFREGNMTIELYNLQVDIREQHNVAEQYPEIVKKIENIMSSEHQKSSYKNWQFEALGD